MPICKWHMQKVTYFHEWSPSSYLFLVLKNPSQLDYPTCILSLAFPCLLAFCWFTASFACYWLFLNKYRLLTYRQIEDTYPGFVQFTHALRINFKLRNAKNHRVEVITFREAAQCLALQQLCFIIIVCDKDIALLGQFAFLAKFPAPPFNGNVWKVCFNIGETCGVGTMLISNGDLNMKMHCLVKMIALTVGNDGEAGRKQNGSLSNGTVFKADKLPQII